MWARGFLDGCALARHDPPATIEFAIGHRAWRTLRVLEAAGRKFGPGDVGRLVCQPETANLRSLYASALDVQQIAASRDAPRVIELAIAPAGLPIHSVLTHLHAGCFERLRRLHLFGAVPAMLSQLERPELALIAIAQPVTIAGWLAAVEERSSRLTEVRLVSGVFPFLERRGLELVLQPDPDHHWNRLEIRWTADNEPRLRDQVIQALAQLPEGAIQRLSFVGPTAARFDVARWRHRVTAAVPGAIVE